MKKTPIIIVFSVIAGLLVIMLIIWLVVGYYKNHFPYLFLSIIGFVIVAAGLISSLFITNEQNKRARTIYLGSDALYNPERGVVEYAPYGSVVGAVVNVLSNMKYDNKVLPMPGMDFYYIIHTTKYDAVGRRVRQWEGDVIVAVDSSHHPRSFNSMNELIGILSRESFA